METSCWVNLCIQLYSVNPEANRIGYCRKSAEDIFIELEIRSGLASIERCRIEQTVEGLS